MEFFGFQIDIDWVNAIVVFISSLLGFLGAKATAKKDLKISEREQLSRDQYKLIEELRSMIKEQKELIQGQKKEINELKMEIKELQKVNVELRIENNKLSFEIAELNEKLENLRNNA